MQHVGLVGTVQTMSLGGVIMFFAIEAALVIIAIVVGLVIDWIIGGKWAELAKWLKLLVYILIGAICLVRLLAFIGVN